MLKYLILLLIFVMLVSCRTTQNEEDTSTIIMRIGTAVLTEKELTAAIGENATAEQKLTFIRNWSDKELAYQAAIESGIHRDPDVERTLNSMRRGLLSVLYIQQEVGRAGAKIEVTQEEIEAVFNENSQNFTRKEPVVRAARIVVPTLAEAWRIRDGLTQDNFRIRGEAVSLERIPPFDSIEFTPRSQIHPSSANTVFTTRVTGITAPLAENGQQAIYLILAREDAGSTMPLSEVIEDVRLNVLAKKQNELVRGIYNNLRNRYDYFFNREFIESLENLQRIPAESE